GRRSPRAQAVRGRAEEEAAVAAAVGAVAPAAVRAGAEAAVDRRQLSPRPVYRRADVRRPGGAARPAGLQTTGPTRLAPQGGSYRTSRHHGPDPRRRPARSNAERGRCRGGVTACDPGRRPCRAAWLPRRAIPL